MSNQIKVLTLLLMSLYDVLYMCPEVQLKKLFSVTDVVRLCLEWSNLFLVSPKKEL